MTTLQVELGTKSKSQLSHLPAAEALTTNLAGTRFHPTSAAPAAIMHKVLTVLAEKGDFFIALLTTLVSG